MAKVNVTNIAELRELAGELGVSVPTRGRPPILRVKNALAEQRGDVLTFEGYEKVVQAAPGAAEYKIKFTAPKADKNGRVAKRTQTVRMSAAEIRAAAGTVGLRGRLSQSSIKAALASVHGVSTDDVVLSEDAVERLSASDKPAKAAKAKSVKDEAPVAAEPVELADVESDETAAA